MGVRPDDKDRSDDDVVAVGCRRRSSSGSVRRCCSSSSPPVSSCSSSSQTTTTIPPQFSPHKLPQRDRVRRDAAEGDARAPRGQVHRHGPLDDLQQLVAPSAGIARPDAQLLQQLREQAAEALEGARQPHGRVYAHDDVFGRREVQRFYLPGLGQGGVEERQQGLVGDVRAGAGGVAAVPAEERGVVVAVEEDVGLCGGVLFFLELCFFFFFF